MSRRLFVATFAVDASDDVPDEEISEKIIEFNEGAQLVYLFGSGRTAVVDEIVNVTPAGREDDPITAPLETE